MLRVQEIREELQNFVKGTLNFVEKISNIPFEPKDITEANNQQLDRIKCKLDRVAELIYLLNSDVQDPSVVTIFT
jgi:hypothetical protein